MESNGAKYKGRVIEWLLVVLETKDHHHYCRVLRSFCCCVALVLVDKLISTSPLHPPPLRYCWLFVGLMPDLELERISAGRRTVSDSVTHILRIIIIVMAEFTKAKKRRLPQ